MGFRAWLVAAALLLNAVAQQPAILRIRITIVDADQQTRPVPRHALLISENPTSAAPQRVMTALDGTAEISLRPGNYTVESDQPLIFQGKAYEWAQTLDVPRRPDDVARVHRRQRAGRSGRRGARRPPPVPARAGNASALLLDWQNSVVTIWSPTKLGAGFLIDARGLIATNQRLVGTAKSLEVQLSPTVKVAARVLASDPDKNVAILWIDPKAVASARPMRLGYADARASRRRRKRSSSPSARRSDDEKRLASGTVSASPTHTILADIAWTTRTSGAPLFNAAGDVVAITTPEDDTPGDAVDEHPRGPDRRRAAA